MHDLRSLDMIERFIAYETTSHRSNLPLIGFVRDYLAEHGIESHLTYDDERRKANLLATIGPAHRPGIILSGHTDTVPVEGQSWSTDPYALSERNGRIYGRGVADMKGFVAIATAFAPIFASRSLSQPVHLAMSYDEEVGCHGVHRLLADMAARGLRPRACIVGEPSEMQVVRAHKGKLGQHVTVRGLAAHSGVPQNGVNAVMAAGEAIAALRHISRRLQQEGPFDPDFTDPPYTTLEVCQIEGGTAVNIVPAHCAFDFDIRYLPGVDPHLLVDECKEFVAAKIEPEMRAVSEQCGFDWQDIPGCAALDTAETAEVTGLARELSQSDGSLKVGFGTEAGHFQEAGIATVVCGPGSIDQAHKPDEFLSIDQVRRCEEFMWRLADTLSN